MVWIIKGLLGKYLCLLRTGYWLKFQIFFYLIRLHHQRPSNRHRALVIQRGIYAVEI